MSTSHWDSTDHNFRTPWRISTYQADWIRKFNAEKEILKPVFGGVALEIEHIGSTAVEGLASKPIVDIAVLIDSHEHADGFVEPLARIGYNFEPRASSGERHFYTKGDPTEFNLSVAYADRGGFWMRQILFRDYLRTNLEARNEYAALKEQLLRIDPSGNGYTKGKTDFVYRILRQAGWKEG